MGTLTLLELKDEIRSGLGNRTDVDDRLTRLINLAQIRMARAHHFDELGVRETLSFPSTGDRAVDKYVSLASFAVNPVWRIWSIRLTHEGSTVLADARKLSYIRPRVWDSKIPAVEYFSSGKPRLYTRWGGLNSKEIEIHPAPDSTYTGIIRYNKCVNQLVSDTDVSPFEDKDDLLIMLTRVILKDSLGMHEEARKLFGQYSAMLNEVTTADDSQPDEDIVPTFESMGIAPRGEYWRDPFQRSTP